MTDKELANRLAELSDAFHDMCINRDCRGCEMEAFADEGVCLSAWILKRMKEEEVLGWLEEVRRYSDEEAGTATPNESPKAKEEVDTNLPTSAKRSDTPPTADKMEAVQLPAWCKVGQWIISKAQFKIRQSVEACFLKQIDDVDLDGHILFKTRTGERDSDYWKEFVPVRFRQYSFEEAKGLIGKTLEVPEQDGFCGIDLICSVSYDRESGDILINGESFNSHSKDGCLIDGVPIGVPVIDEEALRYGEE